MEDTQPGWELYRSFLAVLHEGSLSGAARALGLTQPTVGRHIDALEKAVGFALFVRSRNGLAATPGAESLRSLAETLASTASALLRVASGVGEGVQGTVRITASEIIGAEVLPTILVQLASAWPQLDIELVLSNRIDNLLSREADIAVRMTRPAQQAIVARYVGSAELGLFAHSHYLASRPAPLTLADLNGHCLIGFDQETAFIRSVQAQTGLFRRESFRLRTDSDLAHLAALRAGFGIGVCQVALARRNPGLQRILGEDFCLPLPVWLGMHEDLRSSPRCRVVFDALYSGLAAYLG